jgi:16S rRNA (guanine966-N2)-methyltransferase
VLRVIGGIYRGRMLQSLPGDSTRPPLARVRAAVANIVNDYIPGASILDAFSGTGSYSIELLSRGASSATCIDKNPKAVGVIKKNVSSLKIQDKVKILTGDALRILPTLENKGLKYSIVLIAPPYFTELDQKTMEIVGRSNLVSPNGILVLQQHRKEKYLEVYGNLVVLKTYLYGETRVTTYKVS